MTTARPPRLARLSAALVALLAVVLAASAAGPGSPARATVPPVDCGALTVKGKRYTIKADQIRCADARSYTRRYLDRRARPAGYRCRDFTGSTKLRFRCSKGVRVFFAIRR